MSIGCTLTYYLLSIPFCSVSAISKHKICKSRLPDKKCDLENYKFLTSVSPSSTIAREIPFDWNKLTLLMENFVKHEYYGPHTIYLSLPCVALNKTSSTDTHSISHNHTNTLSLTTTQTLYLSQPQIDDLSLTTTHTYTNEQYKQHTHRDTHTHI